MTNPRAAMAVETSAQLIASYEGILDKAKTNNAIANRITTPNTRISTFATLARVAPPRASDGAPGVVMASSFIRSATPMKMTWERASRTPDPTQTIRQASWIAPS